MSKLRDYLLTEKPTIIDSADKLARRFNCDAKGVRNTLIRAGYTKQTDGSSWKLTGASTLPKDSKSVAIDKAMLAKLSALSLSNSYANTKEMQRECGILLGKLLSAKPDVRSFHITSEGIVPCDT